MGLFDIFTRTKRRDELLGEIASQLITLPKNTDDTIDARVSIRENLSTLIKNHGQDPAIVTPVKKTIEVWGQNGMTLSSMTALRSAAYAAYHLLNILNKKDTGLLEGVEESILPTLHKQFKHNIFEAHEFIKDINRDTPYASSKNTIANYLLDAAQTSCLDGDYKQSLEYIDDVFCNLSPDKRAEAINLIDDICLNMFTETPDSDAMDIYSDFMNLSVPNAVRYNLAHNFLILYEPSEIEKDTQNKFTKTIARIYSNSTEPRLKEWVYHHIIKLADSIEPLQPQDSRRIWRTLILQMENDDPHLSGGIQKWESYLSKIKSPFDRYTAALNDLTEHGKSYMWATANGVFTNHILNISRDLIPDIARAPSKDSRPNISNAIEQLLTSYKAYRAFSPNKFNTDDTAVLIALDAYNMLDKETSYNDRNRIFHRIIELKDISPPILRHVMNTWSQAIEEHAVQDANDIHQGLQNKIRYIQDSWSMKRENRFFDASEMPEKLDLKDKIIFHMMLDNIAFVAPYITKLDNKMEAATTLIEYTKKDSSTYKDAVAFYIDSYKVAKESGEYLCMSSRKRPSPLPSEIKQVFRQYSNARLKEDLIQTFQAVKSMGMKLIEKKPTLSPDDFLSTVTGDDTQPHP